MVCDEPDSLNQALEWLLGRNFKHVERGPPPPDIAEMMDKLESQPLERLGLITSLDGYTYLGHETCSGEWRCQMDTCAEYLADRAQWYEHVADCHKTWLREFKEGAAQQLIALEFDRKHRCLTPPFPKAVHDDATFCTLWEEICESVPEQSDAVHYERRPGRVSILHYAFFKAVESGDTGLVNVALDRSLDVNYSHFEQGTALVIAIKNANLKMAKLLLKRGADPFQRAESLPPLFHVIQNTKCGPAWLEMLLDNGVSLEAEAGPQRYSALHFLVIKDRDDLLETFISKGVCLGRVDIEDVTPLHMATSRGNLACVTALLEHGADRNARAKDGQGVLHFAAAQKRIDVLKFWLEQGVDINMQDYSGQSKVFCLSSAYCSTNISQLHCLLRALTIR